MVDRVRNVIKSDSRKARNSSAKLLTFVKMLARNVYLGVTQY